MYDVFHTTNSICLVTDYHEKTLSSLLHPKVKQRMEESEEEEEEEEEAKPKIPLLLSNNQVKNFIAQILTGLS